MLCHFVEGLGNRYLSEGIPCEPDEPTMPDDLDDDAAIEAYIEYGREEYRTSFGAYIREFDQESTYLGLSEQFSLEG